MRRTVLRVWNLLLFLGAAGAAADAGAQVVQQYAYRTDAIYAVNTGLGITTQIVLSPDDRVLEYSTGFSNGWDISRRGSAFYLRPRSEDVDTDMLVRTETRSYIFELRVVATDWKTLAEARGKGVQYKIAFSYPGAAVPSASRPVAQGNRGESPDAGSTPGNRNFTYDYASVRGTPEWLIPASVYDDGRFTYVRMRDAARYPTGNFPAVFMRESERGPDAVVNTTVRADTIVVHGTYPYLVLRQGDAVIGIRRRGAP